MPKHMQPAGCEQCPSRNDVAKKEQLVHLRSKINETVTVKGVESISPVTNQKHQQDIRKKKIEQNLVRQKPWLWQWDLEPNGLTSLQFQ